MIWLFPLRYHRLSSYHLFIQVSWDKVYVIFFVSSPQTNWVGSFTRPSHPLPLTLLEKFLLPTQRLVFDPNNQINKKPYFIDSHQTCQDFYKVIFQFWFDEFPSKSPRRTKRNAIIRETLVQKNVGMSLVRKFLCKSGYWRRQNHLMLTIVPEYFTSKFTYFVEKGFFFFCGKISKSKMNKKKIKPFFISNYFSNRKLARCVYGSCQLRKHNQEGKWERRRCR